MAAPAHGARAMLTVTGGGEQAGEASVVDGAPAVADVVAWTSVSNPRVMPAPMAAMGDVVLVDVRPAEEFEAGQIDGAQSIPIEELKRRLDEIPGDREVVAYCRGPFCAYAHEAVRILRAEGRSARRLEEGWPEWRLSKEETAV